MNNELTFWKDKKILVTGGAGYIGSHTVKELTKRGFETVVYDNLEKGHREAVVDGEFVLGDLADLDTLRETFTKHRIDSVIHFAADSEVGESVKNPAKYFQNNVANGLNLLRVMLENGVKKIVFSSTAAVYGEPERIPILESDKTLPTNPYGESKLIFENILKYYELAYGLRYISLRYFNAAGADPDGLIGEDHNPETHLIPLVLQTALGLKDEVEIFGTDYDTPDGTCIRDYIHVTDLAEAHILALEALAKGGESKIYNLGNGNGYSVKEVIEVAKKVVRREIKTVLSERRQGDPSILVASSEKIMRELGWKPKYEKLETIIETAWNWYKSNRAGWNMEILYKRGDL
ncbi:MAG: UDP-glucose 4-epimerase GalE [bacterium]|nr:UDP-glucose 4-epimerase GalE [bacterium]